MTSFRTRRGVGWARNGDGWRESVLRTNRKPVGLAVPQIPSLCHIWRKRATGPRSRCSASPPPFGTPHRGFGVAKGRTCFIAINWPSSGFLAECWKSPPACLVHLVCSVCLVCLVCLVRRTKETRRASKPDIPDRPDKPGKQNKPDGPDRPGVPQTCRPSKLCCAEIVFRSLLGGLLLSTCR